jgi:hypothetical protein
MVDGYFLDYIESSNMLVVVLILPGFIQKVPTVARVIVLGLSRLDSTEVVLRVTLSSHNV